jgi:hypothetical protein
LTAERETRCECGSEVVARGMCRRCYGRWWHGEHPGRQADYRRRWREANRERVNDARRKPEPGPRVCPVCGNEFVPGTANQVYCPPTDDDRARAYEGAIPTAPRLRGRSGEDCERDRDDDHQRHADQPEPEVATTDVLSSQNCSFRRGASQSVPPKSCSATPSAQRLRGLPAASGRGRAGGSRRHGFPRARCRARVPRSHPGLRRG